jgi:S1-C subfamily serine protease
VGSIVNSVILEYSGTLRSVRGKLAALALHARLKPLIPSLLLGMTSTICGAQTKPPETPSTIYEQTHLSVVVVVTADNDDKPLGQGSGFIVAKGRVVTNHHVLAGASSAIIVFADGAIAQVDGITADSPTRDLIVLSVATGKRSPLKIGDELSVRQGDSVYALGAPRGLELSITDGIVSGFRQIDEEFMIQNTAPIAPGSSGGPLIDRQARVVGVTTSLLSDSPGIYFSIGAGDVRRLLRAPKIAVIPFPAWAKENSPSPPPAPTPHAASPAQPAKGSLYVNSKPPGATVFVNGIKQSGQTPVSLPLTPGQYSLVLRLPGYDAYAGQVDVTDQNQTQVEVNLEEKSAAHDREPVAANLSGTYEGTVHNLTVGQTARFSIFITQDKQAIVGCMVVRRPLYGSGPLRGSIDRDGVYFETISPMFQIVFRGKRTGSKIGGTYRVTSPATQNGDFELERQSSDAPPRGFDTSSCLVDSPNG